MNKNELTLKPFNLLENGLKYDYVLFNKIHNREFKNHNQSLYLVAFIEAQEPNNERFGTIIVYNTFTQNTFQKWLLQDKDGFYVKIKVQYFEKKIYLHEFI